MTRTHCSPPDRRSWLVPLFALAQQPAQPRPMTFFITSVGSAKAATSAAWPGADAQCAARHGGRSRQPHLACLSEHQARDGQPASTPATASGKPLVQFQGDTIAKGPPTCTGDTIELARRQQRDQLSALTEKGEIVPPQRQSGSGGQDLAYAATHPNSNRHEMLTGSATDGRAYTVSALITPAAMDEQCEGSGQIRGNVTGAAAQIGLSDRNGGGNGSWIRRIRPAAAARFVDPLPWGGLFYCFAIN